MSSNPVFIELGRKFVISEIQNRTKESIRISTVLGVGPSILPVGAVGAGACGSDVS